MSDHTQTNEAQWALQKKWDLYLEKQFAKI
jgi:hypothetical protein